MTRINSTIDGFHIYVDRTDNYLRMVIIPSNPDRLGLTAAQVATWHTKRLAIDILYDQKHDPTLDTTTVDDNYIAAINDFKLFANPLLDIIAASLNLLPADETVFNLVGDANHSDPTHSHTVMTDACFTAITKPGGGMMDYASRLTAATGRPHLPIGADSVQKSYIIDISATAVPASPDAAGMTKEVITGATSLLQTGAGNVGKYLHSFERFYNTRHPELAAPWNSCKTELIG